MDSIFEHFTGHGLGWTLINLGFFLLGWALGWLMWGRLVSSLKATIAEWEKKYAALQGDYDSLKEKYAALQDELSRAKKDLEARDIKIRTLENEKGQLHGDLIAIKSNLEKSENLLGAIKTDKAQVEEALKKCQDSAGTGIGIMTGAGADDKKDMLQIIEGIGPKMEEVLNNNEISSFNRLGGSKANDINGFISGAGYNPELSDAQSWIDQAKLADRGKWQKLHDYQLEEGGGNIAKIDKFAKKLGIEGKIKHSDKELAATGSDTGKADLLQAIEGIGPKMEEALNKNDIKTFAVLGSNSKPALDSLLEKAGYNPGLSDTQSWIDQAKLADRGKWQKLHDFQLEEGGGNIAKIDKFAKKLGIKGKIKHSDKESETTVKADLLQVIEGIGPKMEEALNKNGIKTFASLGASNKSAIDTILENAGYNLGLSDTQSWVDQAKLADDGKWQKLYAFQLDEGGGSIAKVEKFQKKLGIKLDTGNA